MLRVLGTRPKHPMSAETSPPPSDYTCLGCIGTDFSQHLKHLRWNNPFQLEKGKKEVKPQNRARAKTTKADIGQGVRASGPPTNP